jgi:cytochrome c-type biogenesis protein CcmH/NrfF
MRRDGVVEELKPNEKALFQQLLCDCGGCPHEPIATCTCGWAREARGRIRAELARGKSAEQIVKEYEAKYGTDAVTVQVDRGSARALWAVPLAAFVLGGGLVYRFLRKRTQPERPASKPKDEALASSERDAYDDKLDEELKDLDGEA